MGAKGIRRIALLAYPLVDVLDVAGPSEVFGATQRALAAVGGSGEAGYSVELLSSSQELAIETDSAVRLLAHRSYLGLEYPIDTLIVAGGLGAQEAARDQALLKWLKRMAPRVSAWVRFAPAHSCWQPRGSSTAGGRPPIGNGAGSSP